MSINKEHWKLDTYITIKDASKELMLSRTNIYYYMKQLGIESKKFRLGGRNAYLRQSDVERIKAAKGSSGGASRLATDDVVGFLAERGLTITPHVHSIHEWGYSWFGYEWIGPYPTLHEAIQAAFEHIHHALLQANKGQSI